MAEQPTRLSSVWRAAVFNVDKTISTDIQIIREKIQEYQKD